MKNHKITIGQKLWVVGKYLFQLKSHPEPDMIYECEVVNINDYEGEIINAREGDVFVKVLNSNRVIGLREDLTSWDGVGTLYAAYLDINLYWEQKDRQKRLNQVLDDIKCLLDDLDVDELEEMYELMKSIRKK